MSWNISPSLFFFGFWFILVSSFYFARFLTQPKATFFVCRWLKRPEETTASNYRFNLRMKISFRFQQENKNKYILNSFTLKSKARLFWSTFRFVCFLFFILELCWSLVNILGGSAYTRTLFYSYFYTDKKGTELRVCIMEMSVRRNSNVYYQNASQSVLIKMCRYEI